MPNWIAAALAHTFTASIWMEMLHLCVSGGILWLLHGLRQGARLGVREINSMIDGRVLRAAEPVIEKIDGLRQDFADHESKDEARFRDLATDVARVFQMVQSHPSNRPH